MDLLTVNGAEYRIIRLLGKGKGGYSYLAQHKEKYVVVKQIHHEPCDYYQFGNKIEAEKNDYLRLVNAGIRVPRMIDIDIGNERIAKEYVNGDTILEMIEKGISVSGFLTQIYDMAAVAKASGINIDYYPSNFVVNGGLLYYIDYECNDYSDEWSFENWGAKYWCGKFDKDEN